MKAQLFAPFGTPGGLYDGEDIDVISPPPENIKYRDIVWELDGSLSDKTPRYSQPAHPCRYPIPA